MNIFEITQPPTTTELTDVLVQNTVLRIERIVSTGQTSDWYDQEEKEFVILLSGAATIDFGNEQQNLVAGDYLVIPAHQRHRVSATSQEPACVWLCVFYK